MKYRILLPFSLLLICAGFRVIGPGGGGAMFNPTISPHDVNMALVSCDMTGSYITHDGGRSWRMFNFGGTTRFFVFDPLDPKTIYAQVTGLWRSRDGGEHWTMIYPKPGTIEGIRMSSDHADETIIANPNPLGSIAALAIDPADSRTLIAAGGDPAHPALFISHDAGENWQQDISLPEIPKRIWAAAGGKVYAAGAHGVGLRSASGWKSFPAPTAFTGIAGAPPTFYATTRNDVFVSKDAGATWQKRDLPEGGGEVQAVGASLHHGEVAYVAYKHGIATTNDFGDHWQPSGVVHDAWITPALGADWGGIPLMLGVADQNPLVAYATDLGRTLRTIDGGKTWDAVYSRRVGSAGWTSTGLNVTTSYGYHFDPFDSRRQFITYTDIGLFRSEDGGASWNSSTNGVPRRWRNTTYWLAFDPAVRGHVWSVNSNTHDLPRPKMWRSRSVLNYKGGVCRSDDGGRTWAQSNSGMEETAPTHILLDPSSPVSARVLYVAAFGRGVYKSVDGGRTWTLKNQGITQKDPLAWRLVQSSSGDLYLLIARRSEDGSIGGIGDGALYRSTDKAERWTPVPLPEGVNAPNGLAVDPQTPARMYLAAWARAVGMHGEGGGIYVTGDAGRTWRCVLDRDQHVYDVTNDPRDSKILYAAGFESSAWRSADRGESWTRIDGFDFKWAHRVIPDPADRNMIYVTTFGGSVWHGPAVTP